MINDFYSLSLSLCSNVCGWGLASALFSLLVLIEFIYLYIVKEKKRKAPNPWVLFVFGVLGSVGIGAGVGGFATFLGLGILDSINDRGPSVCLSLSVC